MTRFEKEANANSEMVYCHQLFGDKKKLKSLLNDHVARIKGSGFTVNESKMLQPV